MNCAGKFKKKELFLNLYNQSTGKVKKLMDDVTTDNFLLGVLEGVTLTFIFYMNQVVKLNYLINSIKRRIVQEKPNFINR